MKYECAICKTTTGLHELALPDEDFDKYICDSCWTAVAAIATKALDERITKLEQRCPAPQPEPQFFRVEIERERKNLLEKISRATGKAPGLWGLSLEERANVLDHIRFVVNGEVKGTIINLGEEEKGK